MKLEFWVMRVLVHMPGRVRVRYSNLRETEKQRAMAMVERGELVCLPDGCIAEPVEVFGDQLAADAHREKMERDNSGSDFRVVLNTNLMGES